MNARQIATSDVFPLAEPYNVKNAIFGAKGDGVTNDAVAINAAIAAASAAGGGVVLGNPGDIYLIGSTPLIWFENVSFDFRGATLLATSGWFIQDPIANGTAPLVTTTINGNPAAGSNVIPVASTTNLNIGDRVALRLGDNAFESGEPRYAIVAGIISVNPGVSITIDRCIPYTINVTGAGATNQTVRKFASYVHDVFFRNANFEAQGTNDVEGGVNINFAENVHFESLTANKLGGSNMGSGILGLIQFCNHVTGYGIKIYRNVNTTAELSKGRAFDFSNCLDCTVEEVDAANLQSNCLVAESYCERITIRDVVLRHANNIGTPTLFGCIQESSAFVENLGIFYPNSGWLLFDPSGTPATCRFQNIEIVGASPVGMPVWNTVRGRFSYSDGTNAFEIDMDAVTERFLHVPLTANMSAVTFPLDTGFLLTDADFGLTSNFAGLQDFFFGNVVDNGSDLGTAINAIGAGNAANVVWGAGLFGTNNGGVMSSVANSIAQPHVIVNTTASGAGTLSLRYRVAKVISESGGAPVTPWTPANLNLT